MTAVRTGLWLKTRSALTLLLLLLWPPNKTSANSKSDAFAPFHLKVSLPHRSKKQQRKKKCERFLLLVLLQALYPHHGLPERSGQVDCGEDSERVSVSFRGFVCLHVVCVKLTEGAFVSGTWRWSGRCVKGLSRVSGRM